MELLLEILEVLTCSWEKPKELWSGLLAFLFWILGMALAAVQLPFLLEHPKATVLVFVAFVIGGLIIVGVIRGLVNVSEFFQLSFGRFCSLVVGFSLFVSMSLLLATTLVIPGWLG